MIKQETIVISNKEYIRTYSDSNKYIKQVETGYIYDEAIDILPLRYTYEETDKNIEDLQNIE